MNHQGLRGNVHCVTDVGLRKQLNLYKCGFKIYDLLVLYGFISVYSVKYLLDYKSPKLSLPSLILRYLGDVCMFFCSWMQNNCTCGYKLHCLWNNN